MSTPNTSIDPDGIMVSTVLVNLHVISMISSKDKLCTSQPLFNLHPPSPFRSIYRTWYGEERMKNVEDIHHCIKAARDMIVDFKDDEDLAKRMMDSLVYACKGIVVLMDTYSSDASCIAKLKVMLDDIKNLSRSNPLFQSQILLLESTDSKPNLKPPVPYLPRLT